MDYNVVMYSLTLGAHARRVTVVCLFICLSVCKSPQTRLSGWLKPQSFYILYLLKWSHSPHRQSHFLKAAVDTLSECRSTLMYTYAFAFYLKKNNQCMIFEVSLLCSYLTCHTHLVCKVHYHSRDLFPLLCCVA